MEKTYCSALRQKESNVKLEELRNQLNLPPSVAFIEAIIYRHYCYCLYLLDTFLHEALSATAVCYSHKRERYKYMEQNHGLKEVTSRITQLMETGHRIHYKHDEVYLLHLAAETMNLDILIQLLGNGSNRHTIPLDIVLGEIIKYNVWLAEPVRMINPTRCNGKVEYACLDMMLLFVDQADFPEMREIEENAQMFQGILKNERFKYLTKKSDGSSLHKALKSVFNTIDHKRFPKSLIELPIPNILKVVPPVMDIKEAITLEPGTFNERYYGHT